jgi:uncharacterized RDD family membrane protein YckC
MTYPNANLIRRLAAMIYDGFLIVAIWMLSTTLIVAMVMDGTEVSGPVFQLFLYFELAAFYIYFWHFRGQTLGMQVWKIRVVDENQATPCLEDCIKRFFFATLSVAAMGLGFLWVVLNREHLAWHDIASSTRVVYLGKNASGAREDAST